MKVNYVPFCYKYKKNYSAPFWLRHSSYMLWPYAALLGAAANLGLTDIAVGGDIGCLSAIAGVRPAQIILRKLKFHPVNGSRILQRLQFTSVALGLCIGIGVQYAHPKSIEHDTPIIHAVRPPPNAPWIFAPHSAINAAF